MLNGNTLFLMADLWSIALRNGVTLFYTNADINITLGTVTYIAGDVLCTGGKLSSPSTVGGIPFLVALQNGVFDRAVVTKKRVFMPTWGDTSNGAITIFLGEITDSTITRNTATMQVKDMRNLLNIFMPSRQYQPTCPWVFGDTNCTFSRSGIAVTSTVISAAGSIINCGLTNAAGFFNNGTLKFTSGANTNIIRSVKGWISGQATIVAPFPVPPSAGDAFTITPGCTKNYAGATNAFSAAAQTGSTNTVIYTGLTNSAGYFTGGILQFTSGLNVGQIQTISSWANGVATMAAGFSNVPTVGDSCEVTAVSSNTTNSCTGHSNTANFGGQRFLPVPETSY